MTRRRKVVFAFLTVLLFVAMVEGGAQLYWWRMQSDVFASVTKNSEALLRNDAINFMKQIHPIYGYVLKPGQYSQAMYVNDQGFMQRDVVPLARKEDQVRIIAMGESTTQGHDVDIGNYPAHLRRLLTRHQVKFKSVEVINAGVAGWVSDQVMLRAEREMAAYRPDIVILYVGWNDFQSYDPLGTPPIQSYFTQAYGATRIFLEQSGLKSLVLLSTAYSLLTQKSTGVSNEKSVSGDLESTYRFYFENIDRIIRAYKRENPNVVIAMCTLASRWPQGTRHQFEERNGHVWWMEVHKLGPGDAKSSLNRFNDLIRQFAQSQGLVVVDIDQAFENLDRGALFLDFAHLHPEGYELFAEVMYETLRQAKVITGDPSPRREELFHRYEGRVAALKQR